MKTSSGKKPVRIHVLTGESVLLVFDPKATVKEVFDQVCNLHSIKESHFFGLSAVVENEPRFLDLKQRLSKYAPKEWSKDLKRRESDVSVQPSSVFIVQFQVQYFVEHPKLIRDPSSRYYYYLQLKKNVLQSKTRVQDEVVFTLAATSLHLDVGRFDPAIHTGRYFNPSEYVPAWFAGKWSSEYLWSNLPKMHAELASSSPFDAQADYISKASCIEDVPVHYYKLHKAKKDLDASVLLAIFHQGIRIHHVAKDGSHLLDFEFPWPKVGRLFFTARRFEIQPEDQPANRRLTYYTGSHSRSKYLLRLLRETHSLHMSLSPYVQHMLKTDFRQGRRHYRESYISGQNLDYPRTAEERLIGDDVNKSPLSNKGKKASDKFFKSYNSSTSHGSSHTSGIESDSKQRTEEEEDDNAFVDDFDPIEFDEPPGGGVIFVTQEHLRSPQTKSLSVTDLTEPTPSEEREDFFKITEPESSSESTKSEQTVKAVVHQVASPVSQSKAPTSAQDVEVGPTINLTDQSTHPNIVNNTAHECEHITDVPCSNKLFVLEATKLSPKIARLKGYSSDERNCDEQEVSYRPIVMPVSNPTTPGLIKSALKHGASHDPLHYEPVQAHEPVGQRNSHPNDWLGRRSNGSKTYYDDTHTILLLHRSQSTDLNRAASKQESLKKVASAKKQGSGSRRHHHHGKRRDKSTMHRSGSVDSSLQTGGEHVRLFKTERHNRKEHRRHHRHKSLQDTENCQFPPQLPTGPHFGAVLKANTSIDDLCDATKATMALDDRRHLAGHLPSLPPPPRGDKVRSERDERPEQSAMHQRKMSDACHKTIAAQQRKLSDSKVQRQQHEPKKGSVKEKRRSAEPRTGAPGFTPAKHEVLLRTKHERSSGDKRRPVSYHMTSSADNGFSLEQYGTCYNDAALTSRPPVFTDSFKEVIV